MPGSGKSTLGKQLTDLLNQPFFDLDDVIENKEGRSITQIFEEQGEDYFRKVESKYLKEFDEVFFILATGGGTPCYFDNLRFMKKSGFVIYLDVPIEELEVRLNKCDTSLRPKLSGKNLTSTLQEILADRELYFNQADLIISQSSIEAYDIVQHLEKNSKS